MTSGIHSGSRIVVFGPSGSGKTFVSREIAARLGLPVVELDALFHRPNWQPTPRGEFRARVVDVLGGMVEGWVCDGNYGIVRDQLLERADTVVWLRLPFRVVLWRLTKRTWTRGRRNEELWGTNRETLLKGFLSFDSIIWWMITHWRSHVRSVEQSLAESPRRQRVITLRSQRAVDQFLGSLQP